MALSGVCLKQLCVSIARHISHSGWSGMISLDRYFLTHSKVEKKLTSLCSWNYFPLCSSASVSPFIIDSNILMKRSLKAFLFSLLFCFYSARDFPFPSLFAHFISSCISCCMHFYFMPHFAFVHFYFMPQSNLTPHLFFSFGPR